MTEEMKSVTRRIEDLWNTGNLAIAEEIYSPALVNHAPYAPDFKDFKSCEQPGRMDRYDHLSHG